MSCSRCGSGRIARVHAKTDDRCSVAIGDVESSDYVPSDMGIGEGGYISFSYCLHCGQIQEDFPLELCQLER